MTRSITLVIMVLAVLFHLAVFGQAVNDRLKNDRLKGVWNSDFAIFYRAAYLVSHGDLEEVFRYHAPGDPELLSKWPALEQGYWTARLGFWAVLIFPLGYLPIVPAYLVWSLALLAASLGTAALLYRWGSGHPLLQASVVVGVLVFPFPIFVTGSGGAGLLEVWSHGWPGFNWTQFPSAMAHGTYCWGQDTPLLFLALVGAMLAMKRGRPTLAGLLFNLCLAKPLLMLTFPFVLWVGPRRWTLILSTLVWGWLLNFPFFYIPGLSPLKVYASAKGFQPIFLPALLEIHNYLWLYGAPLVALCLRLKLCRAPLTYCKQHAKVL